VDGTIGGIGEQGCARYLKCRDRDETETLDPRDRDETETLTILSETRRDVGHVSRPSRDRDVETETTSLLVSGSPALISKYIA